MDNTAVRLALVALLAVLAYSNTINSPFTFDDQQYVIDNPITEDISICLNPSKAEVAGLSGNVKTHFLTRCAGYLTFYLNREIHGLRVQGYHAVNLLIHILNAVFLYFIVLRLFNAAGAKNDSLVSAPRNAAFFASLMFALHPIQTGAVTYISQRFTCLAAFFALASVLAYLKGAESETPRGRAGYVFVSVVMLSMGMFTKEIAFMVPPAIFAMDLIFLQGRWKARLARLAPVMLTMLIIPAIVVDFGKPITESATTTDELTRAQYMLSQSSVVATYIRLLFIPINQNLDYDFPVSEGLFEPRTALSLLLLCALVGLGIYLLRLSRGMRPGLRIAAFGIFWFFITLSLESGIAVLSDLIFEHRVYLPSAGFFIALSGAELEAWELIRDSRARRFIAIAAFILPLAMGVAAYKRNIVWQSEFSLWADTVKKSPNKARPHNNLGSEYSNIGMPDEAMEHYRTAVMVKPDYTEAHYNLGNAYFAKGFYESAISEYQTALKYKPGFPQAERNIGNSYLKKGLIGEAIKHYERAVNLGPGDPDAHYSLGLAYGMAGRFGMAAESFGNAIRIRPNDAGAYVGLGKAHRDMGKPDEAIANYRTALNIDPDFADAHFNLGLAHLENGFRDDARMEFETVLRLTPGDQEALQMLEGLSAAK